VSRQWFLKWNEINPKSYLKPLILFKGWVESMGSIQWISTGLQSAQGYKNHFPRFGAHFFVIRLVFREECFNQKTSSGNTQKRFRV
jgi:hypothetical protein